MKKLFILLLCALCLSGCSGLKSLNLSGGMDMPVSYKSRLKVKDYKIKGLVRGEYSRTCFLFGVVCFGDAFIYDDLMKKTVDKGGNSVINVIVDTESSSPFWYILFSHNKIRANGMAVEITKTDNNVQYIYGED